MRLLTGIAVLTTLCMLMVAVVTDHLADMFLSRSSLTPTSRVHLVSDATQALKRAQDSRQAYLTTGDESFLNSYQIACSDVDLSMARLVTDDHAVTSKLPDAEGLREFVHARLFEIGRSLSSKAAAKPQPALPAVDGDLARVQRLLDSVAQEEARDVSGEIEAARARSAFHRNLVITLAAINLLFLGGVGFCAIQIRKLYSLVTMCAWSKRVQYEDKWVPLEEYMRKRFGIRISHGISQEEYDKWAVPEMAAVELADDASPDGAPLPRKARPSKKAAA